MWKLYENFHIFHFHKRIVSAETIRGNTVVKNSSEIFFIPGPIFPVYRIPGANLSQARPNILAAILLTSCFLKECIETQNLGKTRPLGPCQPWHPWIHFLTLFNYFLFPFIRQFSICLRLPGTKINRRLHANIYS